MRFAILLVSLLFTAFTYAHPIPDLPVRASFEADGACEIQVEIDLRCFEADPNKAPSVLQEAFAGMTPEQREALKKKAATYLAESVEFFFEPLGRLAPDFVFDFTTPEGHPLSKPDDIVVLTGIWRTKIPAGIAGYRIRALLGKNLSVLYLNKLLGKQVERMQVLFPGEDSFVLNLTPVASKTAAAPMAGSVGQQSGLSGWSSTLLEFMREGFLHVVPQGLDHILFVLGVFLLSRQWRPLLMQVTTFTIAHTLTLGLATVGLVNVSPSIVEPIIAGSIAVVALENIFRPTYTHWRLLIVGLFGLVHGLGFAGALSALNLPSSSLLVGLLGFNLGVEGGQLAVISLAFLLTCWLTDATKYRRFIVIPGSITIAVLGLLWMVQRIVG
jgi:hydrogenase/urease accessory protein HupE